MKISIITPCFNAEKYIAETIESVISQKGDFEIEYLIVDGQSTDKTMAIARDYQGNLEKGSIPIRCKRVRMQCISEKDFGMYDALTKGLAGVTGDIVAYINADDMYLPNSFSTVEEVFHGFPEIKWLTGMPMIFNHKGQITSCHLPFAYPRDWIRKGICGLKLPHIQQESTFWRRELIRTIDPDKLTKHKYAGDFYLWHCFAGLEDLYIVESCLAGFRKHSGQLSDERGKYLEEFRAITEPTHVLDGFRVFFLQKMIRHLGFLKTLRYKGIVSYKDNKWSFK